MRHACYREVDAGTHAELGARLGELFADKARENVDYARRQRHWARKVEASLPLLECTRKAFPQYVEELEAYARAAGVALDDLWAVSLEDETRRASRKEKCTTVVTNGGKLLLSQRGLGRGSVAQGRHRPLRRDPRRAGGFRQAEGIAALVRLQPRAGAPATRRAWTSSARRPVLVLLEPALPFAHTNHLLSPQCRHRRCATMKAPSSATRPRRLVRPAMTVAELTALTGDTLAAAQHQNRRTIGRAVIDLRRGREDLAATRGKSAGSTIRSPFSTPRLCTASRRSWVSPHLALNRPLHLLRTRPESRQSVSHETFDGLLDARVQPQHLLPRSRTEARFCFH